VIECQIHQERPDIDPRYKYKVVVNFAGDSWIEMRTYKEFYTFHKRLVETCPNDKFLHDYDFESLDKSSNLSGSQKEELSKRRLEFLQNYVEDLNKAYFCSSDYLKLIFSSGICNEDSMTNQSATVLLSILKSKPAVTQPQSKKLTEDSEGKFSCTAY
jgi:phosphomevalonate kinase